MYAWHVHHRTLYETLTGSGIAERQQYIKEAKPPKERPRRLRLLKAVKNQDLLTALGQAARSNPSPAILRRLRNTISALHLEECKGCPWDDHTIFPKRIK